MLSKFNIQIFLWLASFYCATAFPFLGEIKFKKNFEIEHKPKPFKHYEFIKEIVTPFGKFGLKHGIGKRDLDSIKSAEDSGPERVPFWQSGFPDDRYEVEEPIEPEPVRPRPPIRNVPLAVGSFGPGLRPLGPVQETPLRPDKEPIVEITPKPPHLPELKPEPPHVPELKPVPPPVPEPIPVVPLHVPEFKPVPIPVPEPKPVPAPPHPPVVITPPPPRNERPPPPREEVLPLPPQRFIPRQPPRGFNTDIAREQAINEYLKAVQPVAPVENTIAPEKPKEEVPVEPPPPANPILRGSRLALYVGNILLDFISQFIGGGRLGNILDRPITI